MQISEFQSNLEFLQQDGDPPGLGTVTKELYDAGRVDVKWDNPGGSGYTYFFMGEKGKYELQLA